MNLTAIMPARNEAWVLGLSARAALTWCDSIVILDHASEDETIAIVCGLMDEFRGRVSFLGEPSPVWNEMNHRQRLLDFARELGATHIAPVDADEVLAGDMLADIRGHIEALRPGQFLSCKMRNLHRSIDCYRSDNSPFGSMAGTMLAFADSPGMAWAARNGYQHHQRSPHGSHQGPCIEGGGIMHLQFASWDRLTAKQSWYQCMERIKYPSKPRQELARAYGRSMDETGLETSEVPAAWWQPYEAYMQHLNINVEPWHRAEINRMFAEHGAEYFSGLNLIGVS